MKASLQSCGICVTLLWATALTRAANFEFRPMTLANGGGTSTGGTYAFTHTIGQPVLGVVSGGTYNLGAGVWEQAGATVAPSLPDLMMTATFSALVLTENIFVNLSLTVSNRSTTAANSVQVDVLAPTGLRLEAATNSAGTSQLFGTSNALCAVASLAGQGSFTVSLTLRANFLPPTSALSVSLGNLTASVLGAEADLNPADNSLPLPVTVLAQTDWGDGRGGFPVTAAENGAYARYSPGGPWLGARWDNETPTGVHSPLGNWDDLNGASDDEDGLTPLSPLYPGLPAVVMVVVTSDCLLDAWADWNNNSTWADAGEKICASLPLGAGTNRLTLHVPVGAVPGLIATRWRVSTTGGLAYTGYGGFGEVEDHLLEVRASVGPADLVLHIERGTETVTVRWDNPAALLEEANRVTGPFTTVPGAVSPYALPTLAATQKIYRLRLGSLPFEIPTTGQTNFYGNSALLASAPPPGQPFYGQDAQFQRAPFQFTDNGDGTVTDHTTGLMWQQDLSGPMSWDDFMAGAATFTRGGHTDWRPPTIKELYSLFDCRGVFGTTNTNSKPFMDTNVFAFFYAIGGGKRFFDVQEWSATEYVGTTMGGAPTVFGVNFADGRIKGYPKLNPGPPPAAATHYGRYVRGNPSYGTNHFMDLNDGTIFDAATGLMWQKADSGTTLNWQQALAYATNATTGGHHDWTLPTVKQLQSIVDYSRAPLVTGTAAIDTNYFQVTTTESYYWSSTTIVDGPPGANYALAGYLSFGQAFGYITNATTGGFDRLDVHGSGAMRADFKSGDPASYPHGRGPQGDEIRIYNYVRCVRGGLR
jgi:hypothetical protein